MPQTITLTASVGKSGMNKPGDVRLVQAALKAISVKSKALYGGQIDGRSSTALVNAIVCFQGSEGLPNTGKIEPNKETVRRLAKAVPSMAQLPTPQAASLAQQTAAKSQARQSARDIDAKQPLPDKERADLCKLVDGAAKEASVALTVKSLDLMATGRIKVTFSPPKIPGVSAPDLKAFEADIQKKLDKLSMQNASWSKTPGLGLSYEAKFPELSGNTTKLEIAMRGLGIGEKPKTSIAREVTKAYWEAMHSAPNAPRTRKLKMYFEALVKKRHILLRDPFKDHTV